MAKDARAENLILRWRQRNISGFYCENKEEALERAVLLIPPDKSVGISGSLTLEQVGIVRALEARGNKVFNPYKTEDRAQSLAVRRQGAAADFFLASPNAVSETGELVFFSAFGNRIAGVSYASGVILIAGMNKVVPTLAEALQRAREYVSPLNCKRLQWKTPCFGDGICRESLCYFPDYRRMCCQTLIVEADTEPGRIRVVLVGESLGF